MICSNCNCRWAELPLGYPYEMLTKEEETERAKRFESDEIKCCSPCIEELNIYWDIRLSMMDYQPRF